MNLVPYVPSSRSSIVTKQVTILKSGIITFSVLTQTEFNITKDSSIELIYDKDEANNGGVTHVYMLVKKKDEAGTLNIALANKEAKALQVNSQNFLKSIKYKAEQGRKSFIPELRQISGKDYLMIDLEKPVGVIEGEDEKETKDKN